MNLTNPCDMESGQRPVVSDFDRSFATSLKTAKFGKGLDELPERLRLLNGFPRTARFLAADPEKSLIIVRRFDEVAIRNLLFLEGRVAALEGAQKQLDRENFVKYKANTAVTLAAQSWEQFALMGSGDSDRSEIPESVLNLWYAERAKLMQRVVDRQRGWNEQDRDPEYKDMEPAVRLYHSIQKQIQGCDEELLNLRHRRGTPGKIAELEKLRKDLIMDQKLALGYSEEDLRAVQSRWDTAKALQAALKDYQEAVHRYQGMLKLEEPAARSYETLRDWLRGRRATKAGTQDPSPQFLYGSSMSKAYDQDSGVDGGQQATVKDKVSIGKPAARDNWSRYLSRVGWILKWGTVGYIASHFDVLWLTCVSRTKTSTIPR